MTIGYITLKNRGEKIAKAWTRAERVKTFSVRVFVQRAAGSPAARYCAWAKVSGSKSGLGRKNFADRAAHAASRAGNDACGRTPTAAAKAALVALGRSKNLK